jgi:GWxTD domain-containing protein
MKKVLVHILFLAVCLMAGESRALDASLTHASFRAYQQTYLELYLHVVGSTVKYDSAETGMQSKVGVTLLVYQADSVVFAERFNMNSPYVKGPTDFVELRRLTLPPGEYDVEMNLVDLVDTTNTYRILQPCDITMQGNQFESSDIRLLSNFKKEKGVSRLHQNGYFLEPLPYNFYHRRLESLAFYMEIYDANLHVDEDFVVVYMITQPGPDNSKKVFKKMVKRKSSTPVIPVLAKLNIKDLPSGNYLLEVECWNRSQEVLLHNEIEFQRHNPERDVQLEIEAEEAELAWLDSLDGSNLDYYLKAMVPIVSYQEVESINYLLDAGKDQFKRNYIYRYFSQNYPGEEKTAFLEYAKVARAIDKMYNSGMGYGFETDRGRVYLKYGRPKETIRVEDDQGAFPYEIWYYDNMPMTQQRDVRFLFYNPTLASNAFVLLTSTCRGERQDRQWEIELYKNAPNDMNDNTVDANRVNRDYHRQARELYTE